MRVLAAVVAMVTALASCSVNWSVLFAEAADDSYTGTLTVSGETVESGGSIAQIVTGTDNYTQLTAAEFRVGIAAGDTVSYKVDIYQNLSDTTNPTSGVAVYSGSYTSINRSSTASYSLEDVNLNLSSYGAYLSSGETAAVIISLQSAAGNSISVMSKAGSSGYSRQTSSGSWSASGYDYENLTTSIVDATAIPAVTTVTPSATSLVLAVGQTETISTSISPALLRDITYQSGNDSVAKISSSGTISAVGAGTTQITVTAAGGSTETTATVNVTVLSCTLDASSYTYTGTAVTPTVTVSDGTNSYVSTGFSRYFNISYADNTDAGEGTVTVTGTSSGGFSGFSWTGTFTIRPKSLTDTTLTSNITSGTYSVNPSTNEVSAAVVSGLTYGTDYTVTAARRDAYSYGTTLYYTLTVKGTGNYTDSVTVNDYPVSTSSSSLIDISDVASIVLASDSYTYDGTEKTPAVSYVDVTNTDQSVDLTGCVNVTYSNNQNAGTATVTVTGIESAGYTGTLTKDFTIQKATLPSVAQMTLDQTTAIYTGNAITPTPTVTLTGTTTTLTKGTDYTISYASNTAIGTGVVTVTGTGNYRGKLTAEFTIVGRLSEQGEVDIAGYAATASNHFVSGYSVTYTGSAISPSIDVLVDGTTLSEGTEYTYSISNNTDAGTAAVTITGQGNYAGQSVTAYFTVARRSVSGTFTLPADSTQTFSGQAQTLQGYSLKVNGRTLTENTDYEISYSDNTNAGTATITATGIGNYTGTTSRTFTIEPLDVSKCSVSVSDQTYTGSQVKPDVILSYNNYEFDASTGYTLSYTDNINLGTATVTVKGKNNLTGTTTAQFGILAKDIGALSYTIGGVAVGPGTGSGTTMLSDYTAAYTGSNIKPTIVVKDGTATLSSSSDYSISYSNNRDVADKTGSSAPTVTITGKGNYYGSSIKIAFSITARDISASTVTVTEGSAVSSTNYAPKLSLSDSGLSGDPSLTEGVDYEVAYSETSAAGSGYTATITGLGNYAGSSRTYTYSIGTNLGSTGQVVVTNPLSNTQVSNGGKMPYIGNATPTITVYSGGSASSQLKLNTDYTLSFSSDEAGGNAYSVGSTITVTATAVTGSHTYYGSAVTTYVISQVDLSTYGSMVTVTSNVANWDSTNSYLQYQYNGAAQDPALTLVYNPVSTTGTALLSSPITMVYGTDYSLSQTTVGPDITSATQTITASGQGNYTGTLPIGYQIGQADISGSDFALINTSLENSTYSVMYNGSKQTPYTGIAFRQTVSNSYNVLQEGVDYTISYEDNQDVGTATVTFQGIGNYTGTRTYTFTITQRSLADTANVTVTALPNQTYTGSAFQPSPGTSLTDADTDFIVMYGDTVLTPASSESSKTGDYYVTYSNNTNPGTAVVTIHGIHSYADSTSISFNIIADLTSTASDSSYLFSVGGLTDGGTYHLDIDSSGTTRLYPSGSTTAYSDSGVYMTYDAGSKSLKNSTSLTYFTVTSTGTSQPGVATVTVTGTGAYCTGSRTFTMNVYGDLADVTTPDFDDYYTYTGSEITPTPQILYNGTALTAGASGDYTISYTNNKDVGTATMKITATGNTNFTGTASFHFNIYYNLSAATMTLPDGTLYSCTGSQVTPRVTVTVPSGSSTKQLTSSTDGASVYDYTIAYGENTTAGTGTVTIEPVSGRSVGQQTTNFTLAARVITSDMVSGVASSYSYTGSEIKPEPTLTYTGVGTLRSGTDYTIAYSNNIDVGTATMTISGTGNYTGTITLTYNITAKSIASSDISISVSNRPYAGGMPVLPTVTVTDTTRGEVLNEGTDYTYAAYNNSTVSTTTNQAYITVTGTGNYGGAQDANFSVTATDLSSSVVSIANNSTEYTGSVISPQYTIQCDTGYTDSSGNPIYYSLQENIDYTATVSGSGSEIKNAGNYTVSLTAVSGSNFTGSTSYLYTIAPKEICAPGTWDPSTDTDDTDGEDIFSITYDADQAYTGNYVTPAVTIVDENLNNYQMVEGKDYTVSYSNNRKSASASGTTPPTITVKGKGNYGETLTLYFNIGTDISSATVTPTPGSFTYNGAAQYPTSLSVLCGGSSLKEGTDYTVTEPDDMVNAGTKTITLTGTGAYYGTAVGTYQINPKAASGDIIRITVGSELSVDANGNYYTTYSGVEKKPSVTVYDTSISTTVPLTEDNYTVSYANNINAGTAVMTVSLQGNYKSGAKTITFTINPADITGYTMTFTGGTDQFDYTGSAITPAFTITGTTVDNTEVTLTENTDFTTEWTDNTNAGKATVTATAMDGGNYTGSLSKTFGIYDSLANATITIPDQFYTGSEIKPVPEIICGGNTLTEDDYSTVYYSTDGWNTIGYITITPENPYYGSTPRTVSFNIVSDASLLSMEGLANEYTYTGSAIKPSFTLVSTGGQEISYDPDSVTYTSTSDGTDCIDTGTVTVSVEVTLAGTTAEKTQQYNIIPKNINTCTIHDLSSDIYTGSYLTPPTQINNDGMTLTKGTDYTVSYANNRYPGMATVTMTGSGNYTGTAIRTFKISLAKVSSLTASAASTSQLSVSWSRAKHTSGYRVIYESGGKQKQKTVTSTACKLTGLSASTSYKIGVQPYLKVGSTTYYGDLQYVTQMTKLASPKLVSATPGSKKNVTLVWSSVTGANGYQIYRSTSPHSGYKLIANLPQGTTRRTVSGQAAGKTYYYKVRAYTINTAGKKISYSDDSNIRSAKARN